MYYAVFYLDTTNECIDVNMPQPRQLTAWFMEQNRFPKYSKL